MLGNLVSVFIAAVMFALSGILFLSVPFTFGGLMHSIDANGALHSSNIVLAVCVIVGGWPGYVALRYSATLLSIRILMFVRQHDCRRAVSTLFAAWVLWPIVWLGDWEE